MMNNLYQPMNAEIVEIIEESPMIKTFVVAPETAFGFQTGQIRGVDLAWEGEAPFTPSSSPSRTDRIDITIMKAGRMTGRLHECRRGQAIGLRGPYGRGYPIDDFAGKEIYIIGGGVGLAPFGPSS